MRFIIDHAAAYVNYIRFNFRQFITRLLVYIGTAVSTIQIVHSFITLVFGQTSLIAIEKIVYDVIYKVVGIQIDNKALYFTILFLIPISISIFQSFKFAKRVIRLGNGHEKEIIIVLGRFVPNVKKAFRKYNAVAVFTTDDSFDIKTDFTAVKSNPPLFVNKFLNGNVETLRKSAHDSLEKQNIFKQESPREGVNLNVSHYGIGKVASCVFDYKKQQRQCLIVSNAVLLDDGGFDTEDRSVVSDAWNYIYNNRLISDTVIFHVFSGGYASITQNRQKTCEEIIRGFFHKDTLKVGGVKRLIITIPYKFYNDRDISIEKLAKLTKSLVVVNDLE